MLNSELLTATSDSSCNAQNLIMTNAIPPGFRTALLMAHLTYSVFTSANWDLVLSLYLTNLRD